MLIAITACCLGTTLTFAGESKDTAQQGATLSAGEEVAAVQRAADENIQMLINQIRELKAKDGAKSAFGQVDFAANLSVFKRDRPRHCDPDDDDDKYECVQQCTGRYSDGTCYTYGPDFCGPNANCTENCQGRYSDGKCYTYGPDICR